MRFTIAGIPAQVIKWVFRGMYDRRKIGKELFSLVFKIFDSYEFLTIVQLMPNYSLLSTNNWKYKTQITKNGWEI